ncbi:MAG TPA: bL9 family ribosomal protein [Solirubrobacteraceae bacterium]|nr:bL9 family ribosomal protein [Solirubrobacteraceae bacterium]
MPQAILLQDVESLGERGTVVDVSAGYLRNYLQPRKLAEPATESSIRLAQRRQEAAERAAREAESAGVERRAREALAAGV